MTIRSFTFLFLAYSMTLFGYIEKEKTFLLSFPRSGNTWTRYCVEYLTKRPTGESPYLTPENIKNEHINGPLGNFFPLGTNLSKPPLIKCHNLGTFISKDYKLVTLVRNYKECLLRHSLYNLTDAKSYIRGYFSVLETYDNWPEDKKHLIYYEDLILSPKKILSKLLEFLEEEKTNLPSFMLNYSEHKKNALSIYNELTEHGSLSSGDDVLFHSKVISEDQLIPLDKLCENHNKRLYNLYLSRYRQI